MVVGTTNHKRFILFSTLCLLCWDAFLQKWLPTNHKQNKERIVVKPCATNEELSSEQNFSFIGGVADALSLSQTLAVITFLIMLWVWIVVCIIISSSISVKHHLIFFCPPIGRIPAHFPTYVYKFWQLYEVTVSITFKRQKCFCIKWLCKDVYSSFHNVKGSYFSWDNNFVSCKYCKNMTTDIRRYFWTSLNFCKARCKPFCWEHTVLACFRKYFLASS